MCSLVKDSGSPIVEGEKPEIHYQNAVVSWVIAKIPFSSPLFVFEDSGITAQSGTKEKEAGKPGFVPTASGAFL